MKTSKHILIVDDDESIRYNLQQALEFEGHEVVLAEDGKKALDYLLPLANEELPALIILDLRMPVMDGMTFLKTISKEHHHLLQVPIVVASANMDYIKDSPNEVKVEKLKKPFDLDEMYSLVNRHCRRNSA